MLTRADSRTLMDWDIPKPLTALKAHNVGPRLKYTVLQSSFSLYNQYPDTKSCWPCVSQAVVFPASAELLLMEEDDANCDRGHRKRRHD